MVSLGKNSKVNASGLAKGGDEPKSQKAVVQPTITHKTLAHEDEKIALVFLITGGFTIWLMFQ